MWSAVTMMLWLVGIVVMLAVIVAAIGEWLEVREKERADRTRRISEAAVRHHAVQRQMEVAQERLRLRAETNRQLRELAVEMERELQRRRTGGTR